MIFDRHDATSAAVRDYPYRRRIVGRSGQKKEGYDEDLHPPSGHGGKPLFLVWPQTL